MAFKFKDLMISVTSGGGGETPICTVDTVDPKPAALAATCTVDTVFGAAYGLRLQTGQGICTLDTVRPNAFATVTTVTTVTTLVQSAPGAGTVSLAQLKAQLQQALADVERQEREQQAQGLPATIEEADDLEHRLKGALKELQEHRKTLEKGAKESSKPRKGKK